MPNIKIFGVPFDEGAKLRTRIFDLLKDASYLHLVVVTRVSSWVEDVQGEQRPYLQLIGSSHTVENIADIKERLDELDMDIEVASAVIFYERRTMRVGRSQM